MLLLGAVVLIVLVFLVWVIIQAAKPAQRAPKSRPATMAAASATTPTAQQRRLQTSASTAGTKPSPRPLESEWKAATRIGPGESFNLKVNAMATGGEIVSLAATILHAGNDVDVLITGERHDDDRVTPDTWLVVRPALGDGDRVGQCASVEYHDVAKRLLASGTSAAAVMRVDEDESSLCWVSLLPPTEIYALLPSLPAVTTYVPPDLPDTPFAEQVASIRTARDTGDDGIKMIVSGIGRWTHIVGESFRIDEIRELDGGRLAAGQDVGMLAAIQPEPTNRFDKKAMAVIAQAGGEAFHVGYLSRENAEKYDDLRRLLVRLHAMLICEAKLVGRWGEDERGKEIPPGVMVRLKTPEEYDPDVAPSVARAAATRARLVDVSERMLSTCTVADWETRPRLQLPGGKPRAVSDEYPFQAALLAIVGERDPAAETIAFKAVLVPDPSNPMAIGGQLIVVCADGHGPVGRIATREMKKHAALFAALHERGHVAVTDGWVVPEGGRLGVKVYLCEAEAGIAALT